jgi:pyruvate dehydrogenase (quinone)
MASTAADLLIQRLIDWGVKVVFGLLPGDGINGLTENRRAGGASAPCSLRKTGA